MARLWYQESEGAWTSTLLEQDAYAIGETPPRPVSLSPTTAQLPTEGVLIVRRDRRDDAPWVLFTGALHQVRIGGFRVIGGLRALRDRDAIQVDGNPTVFVTFKEPATVVPYPTGATPVRCPRCTKMIEPDDPAVRCPGCEIWYHQIDEKRPCWTYGPTCRECDESTRLGDQESWSPEWL